MKIDLKAYATEFDFWIEAFKPFVEHASHPALSRLKSELEDGRDNRRPSFAWKLDKPVMTIEADSYDGCGRSPHKVKIGWKFEALFEIGTDEKRKSIWNVTKMVTQFRVYSSADDQEILHFHHDMKNNGQLGPHIHMQLSEDYLKDKGRIPIAVPRFPSVAMLPTDCLDLVLSEFFPFAWPKSQSGARGLTVLQTRQQQRITAISKALSQKWLGSRKTPIAAVQDCYMPDLQIA